MGRWSWEPGAGLLGAPWNREGCGTGREAAATLCVFAALSALSTHVRDHRGQGGGQTPGSAGQRPASAPPPPLTLLCA